jgi:hypothetical protein
MYNAPACMPIWSRGNSHSCRVQRGKPSEASVVESTALIAGNCRDLTSSLALQRSPSAGDWRTQVNAVRKD